MSKDCLSAVDKKQIEFIIEKYKKGYSLQELHEELIRKGYTPNAAQNMLHDAWNLISEKNGSKKAATKDLRQFVIRQYSKGFEKDSIRKYLLEYGYDTKTVDDSLKVISESKPHPTALPLILLLLLISGLVAILFFFGGLPEIGLGKEALLDYNIMTHDKQVKAGTTLRFTNKFINMGDKKDYDVIVRYEIQSMDTNKKIDRWQETIAIDKLENQGGDRPLLDDMQPGKYILRGIVTYFEKEARAYDTFEIIAEDDTPKPTCSDGIINGNETGVDCGGECVSCDDKAEENCTDRIKNQDEKGIDCGGICEPCPTCNDGILNQDEESIDCGGICEPCLPDDDPGDGNNTENVTGDGLDDNSGGDYSDNSNAELVEGITTYRILSEVKTLDESQKEYGLELCKQIDDPKQKDSCYSNLATGTIKDSEICKNIEFVQKADICYMYFVNDKDYSVCDNIHNSYLKRSCKSLKQIDEMNSGSLITGNVFGVSNPSQNASTQPEPDKTASSEQTNSTSEA